MLRLQRVREDRALSRAEVSRRARLAPTTYGRIERGMETPYDVWKARIADALGYPVECVDDLFEEAS